RMFRFAALVTIEHAADLRLNSHGLMTCGSSIRFRRLYTPATARVEANVLILESPFGFQFATRTTSADRGLSDADGERAGGTTGLQSMTSNAAKPLSL